MSLVRLLPARLHAVADYAVAALSQTRVRNPALVMQILANIKLA